MLIDLLGRETGMLLTLFCLGAAPASLLRGRLAGLPALLLAPILGFCAAVCLYTAALWWWPAAATAWTVPMVMLASLAMGVYRWWSAKSHRRCTTGWIGVGATMLQLIIVAAAVLGPTDGLLVAHGSTGPVVYKTADIDGFVMQTDGMMHTSIRSARDGRGLTSNDLVTRFWSVDSKSAGWTLEDSPLEANMDQLFGVGATETVDPFLLAYLCAAALAACAGVMAYAGRRTWAAGFSGVLFGGATFLQFYFDGSEPAICSSAVIVALVVVATDTVRSPSWSSLCIVGLLIAGLAAALPVLLIPIGMALAFIWVVSSIASRWPSRTSPASSPPGLPTPAVLAALVLVPAALYPFGTYRAVAQLSRLGHLASKLPRYDLNLATVPAWLWQSDGLYDLGFVGHDVVKTLLLGVALPLMGLALGVVALRTRTLNPIVVPLVPASVVFAVFGAERAHSLGRICTYCLDRGLDPVAAIVPLLMGVGLARILRTPSMWVRLGSLGVAASLLAGVGYAASIEYQLFDRGSYFLDSYVRSVATHVPTHGCVVLEGFDEAAPSPPAEQVLVYALVEERVGARVSVITDADDNFAFEYFGLAPSRATAEQYFCPGYQYVLTRVGEVASGRLVADRAGSIVLERRTNPVDALLDYGLLSLTPTRGASPSGDYVRSTILRANPEPLQFVLSGVSGAVHLDVRLQLPSSQAITVTSTNVDRVQRAGSMIDVCVESSSGPSVRTVEVDVGSHSPVRLLSYGSAPGLCGT